MAKGLDGIDGACDAHGVGPCRPVREHDVLGPDPEGDFRSRGAGEGVPKCAILRKCRLLGGHKDPVAVDAPFEEIHRRATDEARDVDILGLLIELGRASDLLDLAVAHDDDAIAHAQSLDLIVGDIQSGHTQRSCSLIISARISMRKAASRFDSGSSIRNTRGSRTIARPRATRWR